MQETASASGSRCGDVQNSWQLAEGRNPAKLGYLGLAYFSSERFAAMSPEAVDVLVGQCAALEEKTRATGRLLVCASLGEPDTWTTLGPSAGKAEQRWSCTEARELPCGLFIIAAGNRRGAAPCRDATGRAAGHSRRRGGRAHADQALTCAPRRAGSDSATRRFNASTSWVHAASRRTWSRPIEARRRSNGRARPQADAKTMRGGARPGTLRDVRRRHGRWRAGSAYRMTEPEEARHAHTEGAGRAYSEGAGPPPIKDAP